MRSFFITMAALMGALLFLYGGLNLAERGMNEIMALDRPRAAFTLLKGDAGDIVITFGGKTFFINLDRLIEGQR